MREIESLFDRQEINSRQAERVKKNDTDVADPVTNGTRYPRFSLTGIRQPIVRSPKNTRLRTDTRNRRSFPPLYVSPYVVAKLTRVSSFYLIHVR